ncbi:MAG: GIY-YIG nuclease family protein [Patescibacteria group bacterium]
MHENFCYVYVLQSLRDRKLYIGYTGDVAERLKAHNAGQNVSTANRRPLKLIFFEGFLTAAEARRREAYFKTTKGKVALRTILKESLGKA